MEGTLEKRVVRPLGLCVWMNRRVRLTETAVEVVSQEKAIEVKTYNLSEVRLLDAVVGAPKGKYGFALVGRDDGQVRLMLAASTKFEHRRWMEQIALVQQNLDKKPSRRRRTAVFTPPSTLITRKRTPLTSKNVLDDAPAPPLPKKRTHASFEVNFSDGNLRLEGTQDGSPGVFVADIDARYRDRVFIGDEIVGIGNTLFLSAAEEIETGGAPCMNKAEVESLLSESKRPCIVVFRRPLESKTKKASAELPPEVAKFVRMTKVGVPAAAVILKASSALDGAQLETLKRVLGETTAPTGAPASTTAPAVASAAEERKDEPALDAYLRMKKIGAPAEAILHKARGDGLDEKSLATLRSRLGLASEDKPTTPVRPKTIYKGIHWQGIRDEASTIKKRGSLWGRSGKKRESLGAKAESMISENEEAAALVDELFSSRKKTAAAAKTTPKEDEETDIAVLGRKLDGSEEGHLLGGRRGSKKSSSTEGRVEVLDRQKALNLQIAMRSVMKKGDDEAQLIRETLVTGTDTPGDSIKAVLSALPPGEELDRVAAFASKYPSTTKFTLATKFALAAQRWGALLPRILEARLTLLDAEREANLAFASAGNAAELCQALRQSPELRAALHAALALGNRLNEGTKRSNAYAISLLELERLEHTKAHDGSSAIDALATLIDLDSQKRGQDGLDADAIFAALRELKANLDAAKHDALPDRTFEVARKLKSRLRAISSIAGERVNEDDNAAAVDAFRRDSERRLDRIAAAIAALDANLNLLHLQQTALKEYANEPGTPIPIVLDALDKFASNLVAARVRQQNKWWWQK